MGCSGNPGQEPPRRGHFSWVLTSWWEPCWRSHSLVHSSHTPSSPVVLRPRAGCWSHRGDLVYRHHCPQDRHAEREGRRGARAPGLREGRVQGGVREALTRERATWGQFVSWRVSVQCGFRGAGGGAVSAGTLTLDADQLHLVQTYPPSLGLRFPFSVKGRLISVLPASNGSGGAFLSTNGIKNRSSSHCSS